MMQDNTSNHLYSYQDASSMLGGISIWTIRAHAQRGNLTVIRLGRRCFLSQKEINRVQREGLPSLGGPKKSDFHGGNQ